MAWTAPATWSVSEVVLASKMNLHVRDNFNYLKGNAGAVAIADAISSTQSDSGTTRTAMTAAEIVVQNSNNTAGSHFSALRLQANDTGAGGVVYSAGRVLGTFLASNFGSSSLILQTVTASNVFQDVMTLRGASVGVGTNAPQGVFHVLHPTTGGGMLFLTATAINNTLQTLAVAGTVTQSAFFNVIDRANTGGAIVPVGANGLLLALTFNVVNGDTLTVAVTAGGAITVQRTIGSASTHEMQLFVMYK